MRHFGLVGFPLGHSFSKKYFDNKFINESIGDADFYPFEIENISTIRELVEEKKLSGFSVTIPHKESILKYLDLIDPVALEIGAVNSVRVEWNNNQCCLVGYNTDWIGFKISLESKLTKKHKKALILGTGGAAKAVAYALKTLGIKYTFVSRGADKGILYKDLNEELISGNLVIVNTTPLGTFPKIDCKADFPTEYLTENHIVYDLIYNPTKTMFLLEAEKKGVTIINGQKMLELQAEESWIKWNF